MAIFYLIVGVLSLYAVYSTVSIANGMLRNRAKEPRRGAKANTLKALIIIPCKGRDLTLKDNLSSVKSQDYGNYDVVAVVDGKDDAAVPFIKQAGLKWITTDRRFRQGSGKVNAIATALTEFPSYDAYAIADSDILVKKNWLSNLMAPLRDKQVGLSTSFPYFEARSGFWSRVKMVWGFVGQGMMESKTLRFGWGGSLAFKRDLMDKKNFESFRAALSDDIEITRMVKARRLKIAYSREAQPIINSDDDFSTFSEWSNRQTALSINGDKKVFWIGSLSYFMDIVLPWSAAALTLLYSPIYALLFVPFVLGTVKQSTRLRSSCPDFLVINTIMPAIFLANLLVAKSMKAITWRGRKYALA